MKNTHVKQLACRLMDMSEQEYETGLFEAAMQYLEKRFNTDTAMIDRLKTLPQFWKWWTVQWCVRTRAVVEQFGYSDPNMIVPHIVRRRAAVAYRHAHDMRQISRIYSRSVCRMGMKALEAKTQKSPSQF